jgi:hypothetical protein
MAWTDRSSLLRPPSGRHAFWFPGRRLGRLGQFSQRTGCFAGSLCEMARETSGYAGCAGWAEEIGVYA